MTNEVFRYKWESVGLVNSLVLNFPCFTETVTLRKWTSLVERWISNLILDLMFLGEGNEMIQRVKKISSIKRNHTNGDNPVFWE